MSVKLLFPSYVFMRDFLGKDSHKDPSMTEEYFTMMRNEIDQMERDDGAGRKVSNQNGWQSNDGIDRHPTFVKMMRGIKRLISQEMMPMLGVKDNAYQIDMHNSWANKNYSGSWNAPHLHNGCFYSGVIYIHADGDEGNFRAIDTDFKIVGNFPPNVMMRESWAVRPKTGMLLLFPSALMHMVEPNLTDKTRYSISFNFNVNLNAGSHPGDDALTSMRENIKYEHLEFEIDDNGDLIP